jgi:hypothetical protein
LSETSAESEPQPKRAKHARSRSRRLAAREAKAERDIRLFVLLKSGVPIAEIALQERLSLRRAREVVQAMLERREIDPPAGFAQLQVGRLSDAMMVAYAAMMEGDMHALDRVLRIVGRLERYHSLAVAQPKPAGGPTPALAAPALALPAPVEAAEKFPAAD